MEKYKGLDLSTIKVDDFVRELNKHSCLGLSEDELKNTTKIFNDNWFATASELEYAQAEDFTFLAVPKTLSGAIFAFFHPDQPNPFPVPPRAATSSSSTGRPSSLGVSGGGAPSHDLASPQMEDKEKGEKFENAEPDEFELLEGRAGSVAETQPQRPPKVGSDSELESDDEGGAEDGGAAGDGDGVSESGSKSDPRNMAHLQRVMGVVMGSGDLHAQNALGSMMKQGIQQKGDSIASAMLRDELKKANKQKKGVSSPPSKPDQAVSAVPEAKFRPKAACLICKSNRGEGLTLKCGHFFDKDCVAEFLNDLIGNKKAVGITCPEGKCSVEMDPQDIQAVLTAEDFEQYLQATLLAFIEQDNLTMNCPNEKCKAIISVQEPDNIVIPAVIKEKDDDGHVLSAAAYKHFMQYRVRCRGCNNNFCAECHCLPYHKGYDCKGWKEYAAAKHCRFCASTLTLENSYSGDIRDCCSEDECVEKAQLSCTATLECGCACGGVRGEVKHMPCMKHELEDSGGEYCAICYVEDLNSAPAVYLNCRHVYHYTCVKTKLETKWPGARINFDFRCCPQCKARIVHPAFKAELAPIDLLQDEVEAKALDRLRYEGKQKDAAVNNKGGEYFGNELGYAMKCFLFYTCFKCEKPYFAGGYQCQEAGGAYNKEELLCPACQPSTGSECSKHGKDWLVYKCRFCCNVASWFCWGNSHFCSSCHRPGVWQKLAEIRGKLKKPMWEYQQCDSVKQQMEQVRKLRLSADEQVEAFKQIWSDPQECPLRKKHPPSGFEWGLGCSMCEDKETEADNAKAAAKAEADRKALEAKLVKIKEDLKDGRGKVFTWHSDLDGRGIMDYFATMGGSQAWGNPAESGLIKVSSSGIMSDSAPLSATLGKEVVRCVSQAVRNSWIQWDLQDYQAIPTHYMLRHYSSWHTECLRSWVFEGSNDGLTWEPISRHYQDVHLDKKGSTHTWAVPETRNKYRMFRILQTGRNSNNNYYLACSGFELYGILYAGAPQILAPKKPAYKKFLFTHNFDANGIFYYLGTNKGTEAKWINPVDRGMCRVLSCPLVPNPPSAPAKAIVGRSVVRCCTIPKPNMWFMVDLMGRRCEPTHYTLRHYVTWDLEALRNWRLQGSNDGRTWTTLANHVQDKSLDQKGKAKTWKLNPDLVKTAYSFFRILQTGLNSNNHYYLSCSGFELYGNLYEESDLPAAPEQMVGPQGVELKYSYDFDDNGLFYYMGTNGKRGQWKNPAEAGLVRITSSRLATSPPSAPASVIAGRECLRCVTVAKPNSWFMVDLLSLRLSPSHYTLMHYATWDMEALRNWRFEASNDGRQWYILRQHTNDQGLNKKGATHTWQLPKTSQSFRLFRLVQIGLNSNKNHYLALSGLELYGTVQTAQIPQANAIPPAGGPVQPVGLLPAAAAIPQALSLSQQASPIQQQQQMQSAAQRQPMVGIVQGVRQMPVMPGGGPLLQGQPVGQAAPPVQIDYTGPIPKIEEGREFKYVQDFDENGVLYFIGTRNGTTPWRNPAAQGLVRVESVELAMKPVPSAPCETIVGRDIVRCVTKPMKGAFFIVDLSTYYLKPTAYTLRHYSSYDTEALRDWKLMASVDGKKWTKLSSHKKDQSLRKKGQAKTWVLPKIKKMYRMFKILQSGENSNGHWYLAISGFEIYGSLYSQYKS
eukprot:gb/GEZN01000316.1/.p1 GENE.gb/GEZN01000316.1/~~gb/GEZN01000316.1/.p1  ORF type:complete len:1660 (-),score=215.21 gb/GEZN01000316.1/:6-4985(-)